MPNASSVTVKNAALADKIFNVSSPASGTNPAQYDLTSASTKQAFRPVVDVVNRPVNGATKEDRKGLITGYFPVVETLNGVDISTKGTFFKLEAKTNSTIEDSVLMDHATLFLNFCRDAGIMKSIANGQNQT